MRTNIVLEEKMVRKAMKIANTKTKREAVNLAVRDFVARHERHAAFAELYGSGGLDPSYDYKAARIGRAR